MKIYEVIFSGSHGKPNDLDTIYLVRAPDHLAAVDFVQRNASPRNHDGMHCPLPNVVYELGIDLSASTDPAPEFLRGPYLESAYNRGWKSWFLHEAESAAEERWKENPPPK